jgi:prepilin-type N-terminal cleavage/methylation domain-containing protein
VSKLRKVKTNTKRQKGMALLEVIVSLALLGIVAVLFLEGSANSSHARMQADERASAKIIAESVIDSVKKMKYSSSYDVAVPEGFKGYSVDVTAEYLNSSALQKISVVVFHENNEILTLENYKVNR